MAVNPKIRQILLGSLQVTVVVVCLVTLEVIRQRNYLLFHGLVEVFAITIAGATFLLTWAVRRGLENGALQITGFAYGFVGVIDLLHTLTYSGMAANASGASNLPTQFWVVARLVEAAVLVIASRFATRRVTPTAALLALTLGIVPLTLAVYPWRIFPDCFVEGHGLTDFKISAEIGVCVLLLVAGYGLVRARKAFHPGVLGALLTSIALTILSEVLFTLYAGPFDLLNALGHYCKLLSFFFIYRALIWTTVDSPAAVLFAGLHRERNDFARERDQLTRILDAMIDPICIISANRTIEYVNAAMVRALGPHGHGADCHVYLRDTSTVCTDCPLTQVLMGHDARYETTINGRTYDIVNTAIDNSDGTHSKLAVYHDITDIRRASDELTTSERKYRLLFSGMLDAFALHEIIADPAGRPIDYRFIEVNDAFVTMTGLAREGCIGRTVTEVLPGIESDRFDWIRRYGRVALGGPRERFEVYSDRFGRWFSVCVYCPEPRRFATIIRDETQRKLAETELLEHQWRLAKVNEDLVQRTTQLQNLNRELDGFVSMASHDLRAPLRIITTYLDLLSADLGTPLHGKVHGHVSAIEQACGRMERLIEDFLALARIDRSTFMVADVDLGAMARTCLAELQALTPERTVTLDIAPDLIVRGDPGLLHIALSNLIGNAWKFTRPRPDARIALYRSEADGQPCFALKDNGVGFPPEFAARLFDLYYRCHHDIAGSGIGLAAVARVMRLHGGRVWAESDGCSGATFRFTIGQRDG